MLRSSLLFALVSVFACLSAVSSQTATFACGGAGYSLAGIGDLRFNTSASTLWTINPCVPITTGPCAGQDATFCASTNSNNTVAAYYNPAVNVVAWTAVSTGIFSRTVNGITNFDSTGNAISCGVNNVRSATVSYVCNATATSAYISAVQEVAQCSYLATVQTSLVCGAPLTAVASPVGLPFTSSTCGGGLFNLASLDSQDFFFRQNASNPTSTPYWFRPCTPVSNTSCSSVPGSSFCQNGGTSLSQGSGLPQTYTLQSNGLLIQSQDGTQCTGYAREANVFLQCDPTATTPRYVSFVENSNNPGQPFSNYEYCHYTLVLNTSAVCTRLTTAVAAPLQPTFACGGAGFDLTSISVVDMVYVNSGNTWILNPCRPISQGQAVTKGASFAQNGFAVSYYNPIYAPVQWINITNGIQSYSIYGDSGCGLYGERTATVNYICTPSATVPALVSVTEGTGTTPSTIVNGGQCAYTATVNTNAVCGTPRTASLSASNTALVGLPYATTTCGGGLFNLSSIDSVDAVFNTGLYGLFWWRPCSPVTFVNCTSLNASFCQQTYGGGATALAVSINVVPTAVKTYSLQSNGLLIQSQDGALCGQGFPRAVSSYLVCNQSATTPQLLSFTENTAGINGYLNDNQPFCHYEAIIATSAVCTGAAAPVSSSSSSTAGASGGVIVVGGSSSAAASPSSSSSSSASAASAASAASSSSVLAAARSSSSSSSSSAASVVVSSSAVPSSSSSSSAAARSSSAISSSAVSSTGRSSSSIASSAGAAFTTSSSFSSSSSSGSDYVTSSSSSSSSFSGVPAPPITNANGASTTSVSVVLMAALVAVLAVML